MLTPLRSDATISGNGAAGPRPRVLLADDHRIICDGYRKLLEPSCEIVGAVFNGCDVVAAVRSLWPTLLLLDITMPGCSGMDVAKQLRQCEPSVRILMLTMHTDRAYVDAAAEIGVQGFATKLIAAEELLLAVRAVISGEYYLSRDLRTRRVGSRPDVVSNLSHRQLEVLRLIAEGRTAGEISMILAISDKTVDYHRIEIKRKLRLHSNADLVRLAVDLGLVAAGLADGRSR